SWCCSATSWRASQERSRDDHDPIDDNDRWHGRTTTDVTPDTRPNIIVVLCDDLGFGDVGVLFQNQLRRTDPTAPSLRTPRIDQMAEEGLTLTGMYCSAPVCAPSRASLLTGTTQGHAD